MGRRESRGPLDLRKVRMRKRFQKYPEGSILVEFGDTKVICSASLENRVPPFLRGRGQGWVTAEYSLLPRSTETRTGRDSRNGRIPGRSQEIQRIIGRSLRSVVDLAALGERQILVDCDVLQADGGTRTAAITGGFTALALAVKKMVKEGMVNENPLKDFVAAVSVGIVEGEILLDLDFSEDSSASVDFNVVMTGGGKFVELQGTAEEEPYSKRELEGMLGAAKKGIKELIEIEKQTIGKIG